MNQSSIGIVILTLLDKLKLSRDGDDLTGLLLAVNFWTQN